MDAFTNLLGVMEGSRADFKNKGGWSALRHQRLVINCPRPPAALTVRTPFSLLNFRGEFESFDKLDRDREHVAWEDVG